MHVVKRRRNWHRHDYSEINDGKKVSEVIATVGGGGGKRKGHTWLVLPTSVQQT